MVDHGGMLALILFSKYFILSIQCILSVPIHKIVVFLSQLDPEDSFVGFTFSHFFKQVECGTEQNQLAPNFERLL